MTSRASLWGILTLMGAGWGLSLPLTKIAVSGGYQHFGLIFWQLILTAVLLAPIMVLRGSRLRWDAAALRVYVIIALIGTILPNSASYQAAVHLPAGIISILLSMIPMLAFPIAVTLGTDTFQWPRLFGLALGLGGVLLILVPDTALPDPRMVLWVPVALIATIFYACESNYVARWGTAGLDPITVLTGAAIVGVLIVLPLALGSGQFIDPRGPWGPPDWAFLGATFLHIAVYTTYVWMAGQAGATFTAQVSYLVTGFGVLWAILLLGERYSPIVWFAMILVLAGMALVQPRGKVRQTAA